MPRHGGFETERNGRPRIRVARRMARDALFRTAKMELARGIRLKSYLGKW